MAGRSRRRAAAVEPVARSDGGAGRPLIVVALAGVDWPERPEVTLRSLRRWFPRVGTWPAEVAPAARGLAVVHDRFGFVLHVTADDGGGFEVAGGHDGDAFVAALASTGELLDVVVVDGLEPRRATPDALAAAAAEGRLAAAAAPAFAVHAL